jgi:hypothetical protein
LSLKPSARRRKRIARNIFIDVDGLRVLAQIVQPRETTRAMALEWTLASMFPVIKLVA